MDFSPEKLRAHFKDLSGKRAKIDAKLEPLRAELNALVAGESKLSLKDAKKREAKVREDIRKHENELYPIEMERAAVARALGGRTGGDG